MSSGTPSFLARAAASIRRRLARAFEVRHVLNRPLIPLLFREKTSWLGVTYDNEPLQDGAGAQLQRIYSTYALTRLLKLQYIHSPLKRIRYQGLASVEANTEDPGLANRYNEVFSIPSDLELPEEIRICHCETPDALTLWKLKTEAERRRRFTLIRCVYPYPVQESHPDSYTYVREVTPFPARPAGPSPVRIALHVRRGDLYAGYSHRILPNAYYIQVAHGIRAVLESLHLNYVIELYGELPTKPFHVTPQSIGFAGRIDRPVLLDPGMYKMEEFDALPHLQKFINLDAIESLERMATADILVISRSSFSFLAAILNPRAVVLYSKFWHVAPPAWISTERTGNFPSGLFREKLAENGLA